MPRRHRRLAELGDTPKRHNGASRENPLPSIYTTVDSGLRLFVFPNISLTNRRKSKRLGEAGMP
jgi:hypothetical protein